MDKYENLSTALRTHTCGELRPDQSGAEVRLTGWIARKRDHGGVLFVNLRDHYGSIQCVFDDTLIDQISEVRLETVLRVYGKVRARDPEMENPNLPTGKIELAVEQFEILGDTEQIPFRIYQEDPDPESLRLQYRFLELRRKRLHEAIVLRAEVIREVRTLLESHHFLELQTPIITASSPEGARDYLVPSRLHPGKFFALPQAPQMFKQLIMASGYDRYFQIAPCFRDEDARADRSPAEFYQIDMEMAFVEQDDVLAVNEALIQGLCQKFAPERFSAEVFPRIPYQDAMNEFGTDKPDLRNPLQITDVSDVFLSTDFQVFRQVIESKGSIKAIAVLVQEQPSRKFFDDTIEKFKQKHGSGLAYLFFEDQKTQGSIKKFFRDDELDHLKKVLSLEKGRFVVFFAAGPAREILPALGELRVDLAQLIPDRIDQEKLRFCWVTDFPLYDLDDRGKIEFSHNPFSMPQGGIAEFDKTDPLEIKGYQYDLVCNGSEIGSGAIRNHIPEGLYKAFSLVGYDQEGVDKRFGAMIRAFRFGTPPHGGFAHGLDRLVMLFAREEAIRNVILFPLAQTGEDLMMDAPSEVSEEQLKEIHIQLRKTTKKKS